MGQYLGVVYVALLGYLCFAALTREDIRRVVGVPLVAAAGIATVVAYASGWTNLDLSFSYVNWGRTMAEHGFGRLYERSSAALNYPPLYPAVLSSIVL